VSQKKIDSDNRSILAKVKDLSHTGT